MLEGLSTVRWDADAWDEVVEALPQGIVVHDATGAIVAANERAGAILGLTSEQLLGRDAFDPGWRTLREDGSDFPGDDHPAMVTLRTGEVCDGVVMGVEPPTGERRWIRVSSRPITGGRSAGRAVATFTDVTAEVAARRALAERELVYRILTETSRDHIVHADDDGTIRYQSPASLQAAGGKSNVGRRMLDVMAHQIHPDDLERVLAAMGRVGQGDGGDRSAELRIRHADGDYHWYDVRAWRADGIPGVVLEAHDITAVKEAERRVADAEALFRSAFEEAPIGLSLASVDDLAEPRLVVCNRLYAHAFGYEPEDLVHRPVHEVIHPDDWTAAQAARHRLVAGETTRERMQVRIVRRDGSVLWCSMTRSLVRGEDGRPRYTMAQLEDATETRAVVDQLAALAHTDPLTGVANRRGLDAELTSLLADPVVSVHAALYFVDLDGFKEINDAHGHAAGDTALRAVAERLIALTRTGDTVARVGGDEFVVLARHVGSDDAARRLGERLAAMEVRPGDLAGLAVRASVGMARPRPYDSAQALVDRADRMMYRVKHRRALIG